MDELFKIVVTKDELAHFFWRQPGNIEKLVENVKIQYTHFDPIRLKRKEILNALRLASAPSRAKKVE